MSRRRMFFALALVLSLILSIPALSVSLGSGQEVLSDTDVNEGRSSTATQEAENVTMDKNTEHYDHSREDSKQGPIRINNDTEFAEQAEENDWPGNGTEDSPYMIEDHEIDARDHGSGIYIGNVTAHFEIRECRIENSSGRDEKYFKNSGIYLYNVSNGRIEGNSLSNNSIGIMMSYSSDNLLISNEIVDNLKGMNITSSEYNILGDNKVSENQEVGIYFASSHRNDISLNRVSHNQGPGVSFVHSNNNSITDHESVLNKKAGLAFYQSDHNSVGPSVLNHNEKGIELISSDENVVKNTMVIENDFIGIYLDSSDSNVLENNNVSLNGGGLYLVSSDSNVINYTSIFSNINYGISVETSEDNLIYHNDLIENGEPAYDDNSNHWNYGYPDGGNYWSDHEGRDDKRGEDQNKTGSDGIVDSPYEIKGDGGAQDDYPLVEPVPTPHVRIESPNDGDIISSSTASVNWTAEHRFTDSLIYEVRVDQGEWIDLSNVTRYNFTRLELGEHTVEVRVRDMRGNTNTDSVTFQIDYQVDEMEISPLTSTITAGESQIYNATGYHEGDEIGLIPVNWSIEDRAGGYWERYIYTSEIAGKWNVTATYTQEGNGLEDDTTLTVEPASASQFELDTIDEQIAGESFEVSITAYDEFGNLPEYYSGVANLADSTGTIEPDQVNFTKNTWSGNVTITGARHSVTIKAYDYDGRIFGESDPFDVRPGDSDHIDIIPASDQTVSAGESLNFLAEVYDTYKNLITDDDSEFEWMNASEIGVFSETVAGEYQVKASYGNLTSEVITVIVEPSRCTRVDISPSEDLNITAGDTIDFNASAYDEYDNLITDHDGDFLWTAEGGSITAGVFDENKTGVYNVTAIYHEGEEVRSDEVSIKVELADPDHIVLEPGPELTIEANETLHFSAEVYDTHDNLISDDDTDFSWDNTDETGRFQKTEAGDYTVTASYGGISKSVTVEVEPGPPDRVEIYPGERQTITAGERVEFSAWANDTHGNVITQNVDDFVWENIEDPGLFDDTKAGRYNVYASYDNVFSEIVIVEVEPRGVHRVELGPSGDQEINSLQTIDFSAEAYDVYDNIITDDPGDFTWENTSDEGLFDPAKEGEYHVTATFENVSSSPVMVEVGLLEYRIEVGPILDVNGDLVSDASVTLYWDDKEETIDEGTRGVYEFDIELRRPPEETEFNYTIEHEDLEEPVSDSFYGEVSGGISVEGIGTEPRDPAGVGLNVIIILVGLIIVIAIAMIMMLQKSQEVGSLEEIEELEKMEDDLLDEEYEEIVEMKKGSDEDIFDDFDEENFDESDEAILDDLD